MLAGGLGLLMAGQDGKGGRDVVRIGVLGLRPAGHSSAAGLRWQGVKATIVP